MEQLADRHASSQGFSLSEEKRPPPLRPIRGLGTNTKYQNHVIYITFVECGSDTL